MLEESRNDVGDDYKFSLFHSTKSENRIRIKAPRIDLASSR